MCSCPIRAYEFYRRAFVSTEGLVGRRETVCSGVEGEGSQTVH